MSEPLNSVEEMPTDQEEEVDEDLEDILHRCHYCLSRVISIKQPKWLHNEVAVLVSDVEDLISWTRLH